MTFLMVVSYTGYPHTQSLAMASVGIFLIFNSTKTVTKFIVTVSAWQLVPTRLFALGFLLG